MKPFFLMSLILLLFSGVSRAEPAREDANNIKRNIYLLEDQCGYIIGENITSKMARSSKIITDKVIHFDFYLALKLKNRGINATLSFSCFTPGSSIPTSGVWHNTTAADQISLEDSGGRYQRNIAWQRKYHGKGWRGTIAYVNSVYGDQKSLDNPDYFLICPDEKPLPCFSFEVTHGRLKQSESDKIPEILGGIGIADTLPSTSGASSAH